MLTFVAHYRIQIPALCNKSRYLNAQFCNTIRLIRQVRKGDYLDVFDRLKKKRQRWSAQIIPNFLAPLGKSLLPEHYEKSQKIKKNLAPLGVFWKISSLPLFHGLARYVRKGVCPSENFQFPRSARNISRSVRSIPENLKKFQFPCSARIFFHWSMLIRGCKHSFE